MIFFSFSCEIVFILKHLAVHYNFFKKKIVLGQTKKTCVGLQLVTSEEGEYKEIQRAMRSKVTPPHNVATVWGSLCTLELKSGWVVPALTQEVEKPWREQSKRGGVIWRLRICCGKRANTKPSSEPRRT